MADCQRMRLALVGNPRIGLSFEMPSWDAELYLRFERERTLASHDLVARVTLAAPRRIIDLGCGPGNSTAVVRGRWPEAKITGLDSSPAMLEKARTLHPGLDWQLADLATWQPEEPYDLVFSNATLQWVPEHAALIPRLFGAVTAGGALAVQVPSHLDSPVQRAILETAAEARWSDRTAHASWSMNVLEPSGYYDLLCGEAAAIDMWVTTYQHILPDAEAIIEWMRGTGLRPFLEALRDDAERAEFEQKLLARYRDAYPRQRDGRVIFPFRRLFFVAYRPVV